VIRRLKGCESGATAVELAMVLPMFIALLFGIFNFGWAIYCGGEVRNAVEQASRELLEDPDLTIEELRASVAARLHGATIDQVALSKTTETVGASTQVARISWTYSYIVDTPFLDQKVFNFDSSIVTPLREN
jgi:Flp pilus assembly protein TadG